MEMQALSVCFELFTSFREGNDLEDGPRSGWPLTARNPKTVVKVRKLVARDYQVSVNVVEDELHIAGGRLV
jgi:hypothetical protein